MTTAIEERREWFRLVESEGDGNDGGDRLVEESSDEGAWSKKKNDHTAVNEDVDVPTHSERSPSLRDRQYECTRIMSETFRDSCQ